MEMEIAFWAVGAFVFGLVCVSGYSFAQTSFLVHWRTEATLCHVFFVCCLCFGNHGSCEDTQTFRAVCRFPVVILARTLVEEFFV